MPGDFIRLRSSSEAIFSFITETLAVPRPAEVFKDDLLVMFAFRGRGGSGDGTFDVVDTAWNEIAQESTSRGAFGKTRRREIWVLWRRAGTSEPSSYTCTFGGPGARKLVWIVAYAGVDWSHADAPIQDIAFNSETDDPAAGEINLTAPTVEATEVGAALVCAWMHGPRHDANNELIGPFDPRPSTIAVPAAMRQLRKREMWGSSSDSDFSVACADEEVGVGFTGTRVATGEPHGDRLSLSMILVPDSSPRQVTDMGGARGNFRTGLATFFMEPLPSPLGIAIRDADPDIEMLVDMRPSAAPGTEEKLLYAGMDSPTRPDDDPAHSQIEGRIKGGLLIERSLWEGDQIGGVAIPSVGEIELANEDGALDDLEELAWHARRIQYLAGVKSSPRELPPLVAFEPVFTGAMARPRFGRTSVFVPVRDPRYRLDQAADVPRYDDTAHESIRGFTQPVCIGHVWGLTPTLENPSLLIYRVHHTQVQEIRRVWVGGKEWPRDEANSPGLWTGDEANGTIQLLAAPPGRVTAEVVGDAFAGSLPGDVIVHLMTELGPFGWPGEFRADEIVQMNASAPYPLGLYLPSISGEYNLLQLVTEVTQSVLGWVTEDGHGLISVGLFRDPVSEVPTWTLEEHEIIDVEPVPVPQPTWRERVGYRRNWTPLTESDLGGQVLVDPELAEQFTREYLVAEAEDDAVKDLYRHPVSVDLRPSLLTREPDAKEMADVRLGLFGRITQMVNVRTKLQGLEGRVGTVGTVVWPRHGMAGGAQMRVVAQTVDMGAREVTLSCWRSRLPIVIAFGFSVAQTEDQHLLRV